MPPEPSGKLVLEIPLGGDPETTFLVAAERLLLELGLEPDLEVSKAVKPHHSQFMHRAAGKFAKTPALTLGPRLTEAEREAAKATAAALQSQQLGPRLQQHLSDCLGVKISPDEWYARCEKDLRFFYEALYRCGKQAAGDPALVLTSTDKAVLKRIVDDELHYLDGFRNHLTAGAGKMPYEQRMALYAAAAWEAYWNGFALGDRTPGRQLRWRYGATENHCGLQAGGAATGCSDFVALGWLGVEAFVKQVLAKGFAPRSGMLECQGHHCLCFLGERVLGETETEQTPPYPEFMPATVDATPLEAQESPDDRPLRSGAQRYPSNAALPATASGDAVPETDFQADYLGNGSVAVAPKLVGDGSALYALLASLFFIIPEKREKVLRDAVAYRYFNEQHLAAYENNPEVLRRLVAVSDRAVKWLRARHSLTEEQATEVVKRARALRAFFVDGRFVHWATPEWREPRLEDYPDLRRTYEEAER